MNIEIIFKLLNSTLQDDWRLAHQLLINGFKTGWISYEDMTILHKIRFKKSRGKKGTFIVFPSHPNKMGLMIHRFIPY